jgi:hypothetical protein
MSFHLVASCTNRKRSAPRAPLFLREHHGSTAARAKSWLRALSEVESPTHFAVDLYCGEHWEIARNTRAESLWIASAGYGLVSASDTLKPYAATFSPGHEDSVGEAAVQWWRALGDWDGPGVTRPRSLAALARTTNRPLIVAAAPPYVRAMNADLIEAARHLGDQLVIVTSRFPASDELSKNLVTSDARLTHVFGGSRVALNARVAADIAANLGERPISAAKLRRHYAQLASAQPKASMPEREAVSDNVVIAFIRQMLTSSPNAKHSALLRVFREGGHACEQKRFRSLYQDVFRSN